MLDSQAAARLARGLFAALGRKTIWINAMTSSLGYRAERRNRRHAPPARPRVTYLGFFPVMLLLGGGGFVMAYAEAVSLAYLYVYNSLVMLGCVIAYLRVFGRDEVKWMFVNAALGALGISVELDWFLSFFAKKLSDYPIYIHAVPFLYYVFFTFLFRQLALDITDSRQDESRRAVVERWYVVASVLVYLAIGIVSWSN